MSLGAIGYGDGTFVITNADGDFHTSVDGINWSENVGPSEEWFTSVAYGSGVFVAAGGGRKIYTSTDNGETWEQTTPNNLPSMGGVAYGDGRFVLVGGWYEIRVSETGELGTWEKVYRPDPGIPEYFEDVVYDPDWASD